MGDAVRELDASTFVPPTTEAGKARLAAILALPLREEPPTPEEDAIFEQMEADIAAGRGGVSTEEMLATLDETRRTAILAALEEMRPAAE
jgi:hypothetical protein